MADEKEETIPSLPVWPMVITLRKAVPGGDGIDTNELKFREPTTADIERVGNPVTLDMMGGDIPKIMYNDRAMVQMMSVLATVPPSTIRAMNTRDYENAKLRLTSFFMPEW